MFSISIPGVSSGASETEGTPLVDGEVESSSASSSSWGVPGVEMGGSLFGSMGTTDNSSGDATTEGGDGDGADEGHVGLDVGKRW